MRSSPRSALLFSVHVSAWCWTLSGHQNKVIPFDLGISIRTVEVNRARMMRCLGVHNWPRPRAWFVTAGFTFRQGTARQSPAKG
ncbi:LuxR C-terminal-related transcriptional regulator [Bradyrhizobium japonicum]